MALHKGKPSGINKPANTGTGTPSDFKPAHLKKHKKVEENYIRDDEMLGESVRVQHPNRNANKRNPTNAGGYKN